MSLPDRVPSYAELPVVAGAPPKSAWGVFGSDDELGTLNFQTEERRLVAARGVRRGAVFSLDQPLHLPRPPMIALRTAYRRTQIRFPGNRGRDDVLDNFYLQCSSQWDSLKHIRHPEYGFYNWTPDDRVDSDAEDGRLGVDNCSRHGIVGRGVLLDVARYLESQAQPIQPYERREIPLKLLQDVAETQRVGVHPGDVLMFRTGVAALIHAEAENPETAVRPLPGGPGLKIDTDMLAWLWDSQISAIVSDNLAVELFPTQGGGPSLHRDGIALLGMVLGELFDLESLADDCARDHVYECLFAAKPLNLRGGVGSPANALAIK
jgi:kynurenine formamidase